MDIPDTIINFYLDHSVILYDYHGNELLKNRYAIKRNIITKILRYLPERRAWRSSWDRSRAVQKAPVSHECGVGYCRRQRFTLDGVGDGRPAHVTFMGLTYGPFIPKFVFLLPRNIYVLNDQSNHWLWHLVLH